MGFSGPGVFLVGVARCFFFLCLGNEPFYAFINSSTVGFEDFTCCTVTQTVLFQLLTLFQESLSKLVQSLCHKQLVICSHESEHVMAMIVHMAQTDCHRLTAQAVLFKTTQRRQKPPAEFITIIERSRWLFSYPYTTCTSFLLLDLPSDLLTILVFYLAKFWKLSVCASLPSVGSSEDPWNDLQAELDDSSVYRLLLVAFWGWEGPPVW